MAPLHPSLIAKTYEQALSLQSQGKAEDALQLYSQIIDAKPDLAEVHFQVGRIFYGGNRFEKSVFHLDIATQIKPKEPAIWQELVPSLLCNADPIKIKDALKRLKKSKMPKLAAATIQSRLQNRADGSSVSVGTVNKDQLSKIQAYIAKRNYAEANNMAKSMAASHPKNAIIAELLARTYVLLGQTDAARKAFQTAITFDPNFFHAFNNYGRAELDAGHPNRALTLLKSAIQIAPRSPGAISNIAAALMAIGQTSDAVTLLQNGLRAGVKGGQLDYMLGGKFARDEDYDNAIIHFKAAANKGMHSAHLFVETGAAFAAKNELENAWREYEKAQEIDPMHAPIYYRQSSILQEQAKFDQAIAKIKQAIDLEPKNATFLLTYANMQKIKDGDDIIEAMLSLHNDHNTPIEDRSELGFGIVKALEDTAQYDKVFPYLKSANDDMRARFPYDANDIINEIDSLQAYFADFELLDFKGMGYEDAAPIFVCGMPRSGTTLVEQIISAHSHVSGAGEVGFAGKQEIRAMANDDGSLKPLSQIGAAELSKLGKDVGSYLQSLFPEAKRVSDKSIQTYKRMGLLKAALPNCKIIVVRRDPRDNLLSIYRNKFVDGTHLYAYDLTDLGTYYKQFLRILDFWREKMPEGFMEIHYEELIDDPEKHARALIDYCDLDWEDDCLNFHKSKRQVKTLSVYQVRQPIYKSSVKAWQRYEEHLQPLFEAIK